jgi:DNA-binding transcriptional LysR family regulator
MNSPAQYALTPENFELIQAIERHGSFAGAARELGLVPSALSYRVRALEEALDVLLFDRRSRNAQLTAAGRELLLQGQRLRFDLEAIAERVKRVATGWEAEFTICADGIVCDTTLLELCESFYALRTPSKLEINRSEAPLTRLKLLTGTLQGTWERLLVGKADLVIGAVTNVQLGPDIRVEPMGEVPFVFCVSPAHPLAKHEGALEDKLIRQHRAVAVADSSERLEAMTVGLIPGQSVFTVPTLSHKLQAQLRGLGCGYLPMPLALPYLQQGRLVEKQTQQAPRNAQLVYAWREGAQGIGFALKWWLMQMGKPTTREALVDRKGA